MVNTHVVSLPICNKYHYIIDISSYHDLKGPHSADGTVSGYRCVSAC